jgi:hypothetical protein
LVKFSEPSFFQKAISPVSFEADNISIYPSPSTSIEYTLLILSAVSVALESTYLYVSKK